MLQHPELEHRVGEVNLARARLLAPALFLTFLFYVVAARSLGTHAPGWGSVYGWIALVAIGAQTMLFVLELVPNRWSHVGVASVLWCAMSSTLVTLWLTHNVGVLLLLLIEIAGVGVLLRTSLAIATLVAVAAAAIPPLFAIPGVSSFVCVAGLVTDASFALLIHVLVKNAIVAAESARLAEVETARQLAKELRESAKLQEQLMHAQRMEAVGTLAAGLAHDMNNVLASIMNFATLQLETSSGPKADLHHIIAQADRGAELTRGLLAFSRRGQYRKRVVGCDDVLRGVLPLLGRTLAKTITVIDRIHVGESRVEADPVQIGQVLINFALNAADAMGGAGTLTIEANVVQYGTPPRPCVRIAVSDTGRGMDAETRKRVFEPFFTTKPLGKGSGLGLAIVWGIVQAHGGTVSVSSTPGVGTTFTVFLPTSEADLSISPARLFPAPTVERSTVLVVDDEPAVRESTKRLLERMGLHVLLAADGEQGLAVYSAHASQIGLVILDMGMPVMGGAECFRRIRELSNVPIIVATGYAVEADVQALTADGAIVLEKPFAVADLRREVSQLLQRARASAPEIRAVAAAS